MTNDETPNDEGMTNTKARTESGADSTSISESRVFRHFVIRASFVISHSTFVIYDKVRMQSGAVQLLRNALMRLEMQQNQAFVSPAPPPPRHAGNLGNDRVKTFTVSCGMQVFVNNGLGRMLCQGSILGFAHPFGITAKRWTAFSRDSQRSAVLMIPTAPVAALFLNCPPTMRLGHSTRFYLMY